MSVELLALADGVAGTNFYTIVDGHWRRLAADYPWLLAGAVVLFLRGQRREETHVSLRRAARMVQGHRYVISLERADPDDCSAAAAVADERPLELAAAALTFLKALEDAERSA